MDQPRRYVFTGNASGVSFHIRRPVDAILPVQAASSLPVTGGVSESRVERGSLPKPGSATDYVTFESASTTARGDYADAKLAVAMTRKEVAFDAVPTLTTVTAEVTGLVVIGRVSIDLAVMSMQAESSEHPLEPEIYCKGLRLEGIRVDGYPVRATLAEQFFCDNNTKSKLETACGKGYEPQLFFKAHNASGYGFGNPTGMVKCTVVSQLAWADKPNPNATIEGNSIVIPNFGKVYFGEAYITALSRRVTMVRFQLGSDDGGDGTGASGDTNGGEWPPIGP
jgi:hypothetical protein